MGRADKISLIIVAKLDTNEQRDMLRACYESAVYYTRTDLEVIVVYDPEYSSPNIHSSLVDKKVKQPKPFNYNACLNAGAQVATGNYYYFANSDLLFTEGALDELIRCMKNYQLGTASAICPKAHKDTKVKRGVMLSYKVGTHLCGWGIMMRAGIYFKLGKIKEQVRFYCSDNILAEQLKEKNIRHGLVKSAEIEHLGQQTQKNLDSKTHFEYCYKDVQKFNKLYNQNIFGIGKGDIKNG